MPQLKVLEKKIKTVGEIESVVSTMKTLAAVNINNYQNAAESAKLYLHTIEKGLQVTLRELKPAAGNFQTAVPGAGRLFLVLGSEQGMCGNFNQAVLSRLQSETKNGKAEDSASFLMSVGSKMNVLAGGSRLPVLKEYALSTSMAHLDDLIADIQIDAYRYMREKGIESVKIVYNRLEEGEQLFSTEVSSLYPVTAEQLQNLRDRPWDSKRIPRVLMNRRAMFRKLLDHYFSGTLYMTIINSLAGENAARLASMQAAERNIREKKDLLYTQYNKVRQQSITSELLDIIGGFEVLS